MASDGTVTGDLKLKFTPLEFETNKMKETTRNLEIKIYSVGV